MCSIPVLTQSINTPQEAAKLIQTSCCYVLLVLLSGANFELHIIVSQQDKQQLCFMPRLNSDISVDMNACE